VQATETDDGSDEVTVIGEIVKCHEPARLDIHRNAIVCLGE
jgi:hypothetical protein